jgi:hypothetical protein
MGVLGQFRDSVTLINRTDRKLNVRYDGEDIVLTPGENPGFPLVAVPYAKKQNPLMGSKHPINPTKYICLVGVKALEGMKQKDPIDPIPVEVLRKADLAVEVVDRSGEFWGEPMEPRKLLKKTPFDAYEAQVELPSDFDVNRHIQ